jgi:formate hydrogenlyase subunit 6/NADH:ubiquinone oxidoreductase subunit I
MKLPGKMAGEVLRHLTRKPATVDYPSVKTEMPAGYRGKILFIAARCVGCNLCVKDCPAKAIAINKVGDKRFEAVFDLDRCIFCSQCVDSCNKHALETSPEYELASLDRASLRLVFDAPPPPPAPPAPPASGAPPPDPSAPEVA